MSINNDKPANIDINFCVIEELHELIGNEVYVILNNFIDSLPEILLNLKKAVDQNDTKSIGMITHSLKSSSGNFGITTVSNLAAPIEHATKEDNCDISAIEILVTKLEQASSESLDLITKNIKDLKQ